MNAFCGLSVRNMLAMEDVDDIQKRMKDCLAGRVDGECTVDNCEPIIVMFFLSHINELTGNIKVAAEGYRHCLEMDSSMAQAHLRLGCCEYFLMNFEEAIGHLETALSHNSKLKIALYWIGRSYFSLMEFERAVVPFKSLLDYYPRWTTVRLRLGEVYEEVGMCDEALECYEKVVHESKNCAAAYAKLARLNIRLNRTMDAIKVLKKGLAAKPGNALLRKELDYLISIDMP